MKTVKIILAAVAAIALCLLANSCNKDSGAQTKTTYKLTTYEYSSTPKPEATSALKAELETLCSSSTGKDHLVVKSDFDKIVAKYETAEYRPLSYKITITYTDGSSSAYLIKSETLK